MPKNRVILIESPQEALASAARLRSAVAELDVVHCSGDDLQSCLQAMVEAGTTPAAILLGASLPNPLAIARVAYRLASASQLVFMTAADRKEGLRRALALAPRIGTNWTIAPQEGEALGRVIAAAVRSTAQRLQHRTTLDRVRLAVPAPPPTDGGEYRRLILSERYFTSILAHAPDAIFSTTTECIVQSWNRGAEATFGYSNQEILGRHVRVLCGEQDQPLVALIHEVKSGSPPARQECFLRRGDGNVIAADLSLASVRDTQGTLLGVSVIARDVTDRRRAAAAVYEQKERLRVTLSSIGDGVITTDAQGRVEYLNAVAESLTGWAVSEAEGRPLCEVFQIENEYTRQRVENPVDEVLQKGVIVGLANHTILVARDGSECPIDDSAAPIRGEDGLLVGVVLIFRDVTEARAAERRLLESEQRFRQLADSMPQMIWSAGSDGSVDYLNQRWYEFMGLPRETTELLGDFSQFPGDAVAPAGDNTSDRRDCPILHADDVPRCRELWKQSVQTGRPYEVQCRFHDRQTHGYRWFLVRALPVSDQSGNILRWFGSCTDIDDARRAGDTARFLAEAAAEISEVLDIDSTLPRIARAAVPTFADWSAVDLLDTHGKLRRVEITHGNSAKAMVISELADHYPERPDAAHGLSRVLQTGEPVLVSDISDALLQRLAQSADHLQVLREAKLRSYLCVPLLSKGRVLGALSFATSESGRRYHHPDLEAAQDLARRVAIAVENAGLYEALTEADRRKDEFLATLAHELRNPLAPIRMGIEVLRLAGDDPATLSEMLATMSSQVQQMVRLIDDLLDVSRITRGKLELRTAPVELAAVVQSSVEAVRPLIDDAGHQLTISLPDEPVWLHADPARLSQVFSNLLNNAAKYTPPGGEIVLSAERYGDELVVTVTDSGIGIPPELIDTIFEMFKQADGTLERSTGGLGIGLTLVRRLVEMHGGSVKGRSEGEGTGSEFVVRLPLPPSVEFGVLEPGAQSGMGTGAPADRRRVLVVDDNRDAADTLAKMLGIMGQDVRTAYDGEEAFVIAESFRPDVVLMDIGMPKLNGYDAASRMRQQHWGREITLVALTGWGQQADRQRSARAGFNRHLVKPVDLNDLRDILLAL